MLRPNRVPPLTNVNSGGGRRATLAIMARNTITIMPAQPGGAGITSRIDQVTRIPANRLLAAPPAPRAVKSELTSQCNYRCGYCAHRLRLKQRGEMEWGLYTRLVGEMVDAGVEEL